MPHYLNIAAAIAGTMFLAGNSLAAELITDDFESYTAGGPLTTPWGSLSSTGTNEFKVVFDTEDWFGAGSGNQILYFNDNSTGLIRADRNFATPTAVATVSFDFYEPSGVSGTYLYATFGGTSSGNPAFQYRLADGNSGKYSLNAAHNFMMVANTSASAVSYNEGTNSVASLTCDVWFDGVLVETIGLASNSTYTAGADMYALRLTTASSSMSQVIYIDNFTLMSGAPIPEASTSAVAAGLAALGAGIFLRRRSMRGQA